jgi:hypothetical protein
MPVDSITHLISYEEVIQVKDLSAQQLYNRALAWFRKYYKNSSEVIRDNDIVNYKITGKPRFKISNLPDKEGTKTDAGLVQYSITISAREGRYKYELTEFNWKQASYYPCEKWMDTSSGYYNNNYPEYLHRLDANAQTLIADLKNSMASDNPAKDKDKW